MLNLPGFCSSIDWDFCVCYEMNCYNHWAKFIFFFCGGGGEFAVIFSDLAIGYVNE